MMFRAIAAITILCFSFAAGPMHGQTFRGGIQGAVTDSSGRSIGGAQVMAFSDDTHLVRQAITDESGNYNFTELPLGSYRIAGTKAGFQKQIVSGIRVEVAASPRVDLTLSPGQPSEIIEVVGLIPLVETSGNNQGGTIEGRQVSELPVNGRDFMKALLLVPGGVADPSSASEAPGSFGMFSINGNRGKSNNFLTAPT